MILRGEKLVYHGEFFHLERGFKLRFTPPRADLPIYIAAMGPKNVAQIGRDCRWCPTRLLAGEQMGRIARAVG